MRIGVIGTIVLALALLAGPAIGAEPEKQVAISAKFIEILKRDTLTDNFFGAGDALEDMGISLGVGFTFVYQANVRNGLSTHGSDGHYAGSWDLELDFNLEKLISLPGGTIHALVEGSRGVGTDAYTIGSIFGTNNDAAGYRDMDVTELWYEQSLFDGTLRIRLGKIDLSGGFECRACHVAFDGNAFANDSTSQFLNSALCNNPTIPFPENGLGLVVYYQPTEWMYVAYGIADAEADSRETGLHTAFHDRDDFFSVIETGFVPYISSANGDLPGAYRFGIWYDPRQKSLFDQGGIDQFTDRIKTDDVGYYLSFDQMVYRESAEDGNMQGLGLFFRLGVADDDVNEINTFWSLGAQYQGLIPTRNDDVIGLGVAQGRLSSGAGFDDNRENVIELYYNCQVAPWLSITPDFQYITNAGGTSHGDALALGVRVQMSL